MVLEVRGPGYPEGSVEEVSLGTRQLSDYSGLRSHGKDIRGF